MKLPNAEAVPPELVARIVEYVGAERLAKNLRLPVEHVRRWVREGIPHGPIAACFRYLAADHSLPTNSTGGCVLCGAHATEVVAQTPVCVSCCSPSMDKLRPWLAKVGLVYVYREKTLERAPDAVRVKTMRSFERPVLVKFSKQLLPLRRDPEIGDDQFDRAVWIDTDEYEAVFDLFMLARRRRLVFDLTRTGNVTINVNEVLYQHSAGQSFKDVAIRTALLAWSLSHETSNPWDFA